MVGGVAEKMALQLREFASLSRQLFASIAYHAQSSAKGRDGIPPLLPEDVMQRLVACDAALQQTVKELEEHKQFQYKIERVRADVQAKSEAILALTARLKQMEDLLVQTVEEGKKLLQFVDAAEAGEVDAEELVAYAHRVSATTTGPLYWEPGQPLGLHLPPAPQEEQLRCGVLSTHNQVLGERIAHPKSTLPTTADSDVTIPPLPPPGWNPGDLFPPPPPPGWKPGDPIPALFPLGQGATDSGGNGTRTRDDDDDGGGSGGGGGVEPLPPAPVGVDLDLNPELHESSGDEWE